MKIYIPVLSKNELTPCKLCYLLAPELSNLIDQIITDGVVNVYQTVKRMRQQRSAKILTRVRIVL